MIEPLRHMLPTELDQSFACHVAARYQKWWRGSFCNFRKGCKCAPKRRILFPMPAGPSLIFDKSALESLNLDEAVLLDNFYMSNINLCFSSNALPISKNPYAAAARRSSLWAPLPTGLPICSPLPTSTT